MAAKAVASLDTCAGKRRRDARAEEEQNELGEKQVVHIHIVFVYQKQLRDRACVCTSSYKVYNLVQHVWEKKATSKYIQQYFHASGRINQVTQDQPGSIEREKMLVEEVLYSSLVDLHYCTSPHTSVFALAASYK